VDAPPTLDEVRARLDALDRYLLALIAQRRELVALAFVAKGDAPRVDPEREAAMLVARRAWAQEEGLDADRAEALFRDVLAMSRPAT
jgi:chorismate mutase